LYGGMDVALDTFVYHGVTTTCEALWMGVPVVTRAGDRHASRVGVSILRNAGLPELIADSTEQYVAIAVALAGDPARRRAVRSVMRERMHGSPLGDGTRFARHVERLYREIWRHWCGARGA